MTQQAQIEITATDRSLGGQLAAAARKFKDWSASIASGVGVAFDKINDKMKFGKAGQHAVGNLISSGIGKGLSAVTDAADEVRNFERDLVRLQITADRSPAWAGRMRDSIESVSRETSVSRDEILKGTQSYVDLTGDVGGAEKAMRSFARISIASGASMSDIAAAAASMNQVMGITGDQIEEVFSGLIVQGKAGAVSLKDMAGELSGMLPKMREFAGGQGVQGVLDLGAAFQVMRQTVKDASMASTNFEALTDAIVKNARNLKYVGIEVFSDKEHTKLRNFHDILNDIRNNKKMKSLDMAQAVLGGRKEAREALEVLERQWDVYEELVKSAQDKGAVERDANAMLTSDAGRIDKAFNDIKLTIAEAFTPDRIKSFADSIEGLAGKIGTIVDGVGKVGEVLGKIESFGAFISEKVFGQNGHLELDDIDKALTGDTGSLGPGARAQAARQIMGWQEEGTLDKHRATAARTKETYDTRNATVDAIMEAQGDSKTVTPAAYWKAIQASWATQATAGAGFTGAQSAGNQFLNATHSKDHVREAVKIMTDATNRMDEQKANARMIVKAIADGFGLVIAEGGLQIKIGDNQVAKSSAQAKDARRAPAKH